MKKSHIYKEGGVIMKGQKQREMTPPAEKEYLHRTLKTYEQYSALRLGKEDTIREIAQLRGRSLSVA